MRKKPSLLERVYPTTIKVGPSVYNVVWKETFTDSSGQSCWGLYSQNDQTITLSSQMSLAQSKVIVCHELIHALFHHFSLKDPVPEEDAAVAFGKGWAMIMIDNPKLVKVLTTP